MSSILPITYSFIIASLFRRRELGRRLRRRQRLGAVFCFGPVETERRENGGVGHGEEEHRLASRIDVAVPRPVRDRETVVLAPVDFLVREHGAAFALDDE